MIGTILSAAGLLLLICVIGKLVGKKKKASKGKKPSRKKKQNRNTSVKNKTSSKKGENKNAPKNKGNKIPKSKKRKNVSQTIPNGRTLQTRDEYFYGDKDYRKEGYEDKGLYRSATVVDSNRKDELALLVLYSKGEDIIGRKKSKYRPFVETKDDDGNPIKIGPKFKENRPKKDLSPQAIAKMKKLTFKDAGNAEENRRKVREIKDRK